MLRARVLSAIVACTFTASCTEKLVLGAREPLEDASAPDAEVCAPGSRSPVPLRPVDIVFILDNSSSMAYAAEALARGLPETFAPALIAAGIDYRIVVVSRHGRAAIGDSDVPLCIPAPVGASDCADPDATPLALAPPRFFHYSADITSHNALCVVLEGFHTSDELPPGERPWTPVAPRGYSEFLREGAWTTFVLISDAAPNCSYGSFTFTRTDEASGFANASAFETALRLLAPEKFLRGGVRHYDWQSVVAIASDTELAPSEPLLDASCGTDSGLPYQALSIASGGHRFPLCFAEALPEIYSALARAVIERSHDCE